MVDNTDSNVRGFEWTVQWDRDAMYSQSIATIAQTMQAVAEEFIRASAQDCARWLLETKDAGR